MSLENIYRETKAKMDKTISVFHQEIAKIRTGVASTSIVENINVECYGSRLPLIQMASISTPDARTVLIQPWDLNNLSAIEKALLKSELSLTPNNDGKVIRINIPQLSEERRNEFVKLVKKTAEESKVAIRTIRRDANDHIKKLEKNKEITEDELNHANDEIQKFTDIHIKDIDKIVAHKETQLREV